MALTVSLNRPTVFGDAKVASGTITFDSSYPTGGESLTPALLGLTQVDTFVGQPAIDANGCVIPSLKRSTNVLFAYWVDTSVDGAEMAEVADTTNLSGYTFDFIAFGR